MVNYLSNFAPNLSEFTSPLRKLLVKDMHFAWDQPQEQAFQTVKESQLSPQSPSCHIMITRKSWHYRLMLQRLD